MKWPLFGLARKAPGADNKTAPNRYASHSITQPRASRFLHCTAYANGDSCSRQSDCSECRDAARLRLSQSPGHCRSLGLFLSTGWEGDVPPGIDKVLGAYPEDDPLGSFKTMNASMRENLPPPRDLLLITGDAFADTLTLLGPTNPFG